MHVRRSTKIVCTIGPSVDSREKIEELIRAGMSVARLNFSHGTHEQHARTVAHLKQARQNLGLPLAIMLDTKGPEVRLGTIDKEIEVQREEKIVLTGDHFTDKPELSGVKIPIEPPKILHDLCVGLTILFDDGYISGEVCELGKGYAVVKIANAGTLRSRKGVNIPNVKLSLPALTQKDKDDIRFAVEHDLEYVAASFIRSSKHVFEIKSHIQECGGKNLLVLAKIENQEGIDHFDEILQVSDGIMIARGDLGVEVPLAQVPRLQKMMIRKCHFAGKPSITATQMLESMIRCPRPTRAEVSDVANAIYDSTSAVMLSGETAVGQYPIEAVKMMADTIIEAENDFDFEKFFSSQMNVDFHDVPSCIALATVKTAFNSEAKAIFCFTSTGRTARLISRLRPDMMILAYTPNPKVYHQMALYWGIEPILSTHCRSLEEGFAKISQFALRKGWLERGDTILMTAGTPFGVSGTTNVMMLECIGGVLLRAARGYGHEVITGEIVHFDSKDPHEFEGKIVVLNRIGKSTLTALRGAAGIILENDLEDSLSPSLVKKYCESNACVSVFRADGAKSLLKEGQVVTLNPMKGLVLYPNPSLF